MMMFESTLKRNESTFRYTIVWNRIKGSIYMLIENNTMRSYALLKSIISILSLNSFSAYLSYLNNRDYYWTSRKPSMTQNSLLQV